LIISLSLLLFLNVLCCVSILLLLIMFWLYEAWTLLGLGVSGCRTHCWGVWHHHNTDIYITLNYVIFLKLLLVSMCHPYPCLCFIVWDV
jgi:hypothetical protein